MSRTWLVAVLLLALAVGAAFALGLVGDDEPGVDDGDALRGEERVEEGPTGPLRHGDGDDPEGNGASLVGRPGESPLAPRAPRLRTATLRVVDASGIALAGQVVSVFVGGTLHGHFTTGADGRVHLTDLPVGEDVFVALGALDAKPDVVLPLTGDTLELRAQHVLPLRVDVVDAETGAMLPGARWVFTTPELRGGTNAIASGGSTPIQARPGVELKRPFAAETPVDFVEWDAPWDTVISRYATALEARHPLRREMTVTVQTVEIVDGEKDDVRDAQVHAFHVAGRGDASPQTGPWMLGGTPLRGVPFFAGQVLRAWAQAPEGRGGDASKPLPAHDHEEVVVEVVLKKGYQIVSEEAPWGETRTDISYREPGTKRVTGGGPDALVGGLEVEVLRADGLPAVGAHVRVPLDGEHRTDETGVLRIEAVLAGDHEVVLDEAGLVPVAEPVEVVAGETAHVTLREPIGATLVVTVKGADGTPLPHAMVFVRQATGGTWADLAPDGLQRLDPYTDERGRRTLRRIQPGRIHLDGRWGSWKGALDVTVGDRQTKDVTLLLR